MASELLGGSFMLGVDSLLKDYFSLPLDEKMELKITESKFHRGYLPISHENAKKSTELDMKEAFDVANHLPPCDDGYILHGPNVYPNRPPHFKSTIEEYYYRLTKTSEIVFHEI
ncbi:MAG: 2-oxoglutarate and iron-dependent oxygenase domain-containing protein, partial [Burkholderiaceae bacterium]